MKSVVPSVMARRAREILAVDVRRVLPRITVPILAITGSRDRVVPRRNVDDFAVSATGLSSRCSMLRTSYCSVNRPRRRLVVRFVEQHVPEYSATGR